MRFFFCQLDNSFKYPKHVINIVVKLFLQFYAEKNCLSKPVVSHSIFKGNNSLL